MLAHVVKHGRTVHHHMHRAAHGFLVRAAERYPVVVTGLAIIGGFSIYRFATQKPASGVHNTGGV